MRELSRLDVEISNKFAPKKKYAKKLANVYKRIGLDKKSKTVGSCANFIEYGVYSDDTARLNKVYFCKDKLCPLCAWRKELKLFNQVSKCVDVLQAQKYRFVFVTLTMRNCEATSKALQETLDDYNAAYVRLVRLNRIKRIVKGAYRAIEVTYNAETDTFHPHMHLIWVVPKNYFDSHDYIKQSELCELWKQSLNIDYTPICDIRVVSGKKVNKNGKIISFDLKSAVAEACKYAIKQSDYLNHSDEVNDKVVMELVKALARRRLVSFYGVFAEVRRQLNLDDDIENGDLLHVSDDDNNAELLYTMCFRWDNKSGTYIQFNVIMNIDINIRVDEDELLTG